MMTVALLKICGLALLCAVAALILGSMKGEFSGLVRLGGSILIFGALLLGLGELLSEVRGLFEGSGIDRYADLMLRALGLGLLTKLCCALCEDCGAKAVASGVEMAGKAAILMLSLPLVKEILSLAATVLEME